ATDTDKANEQHYELPPEFFELILGPHLKYSSAYYPEGVTKLGDAEEAALSLIDKRAQLEDGQEVLDMGCGWGSFSMRAAAKFPNSRFTLVSNSSLQADHIRNRAAKRGLANLEVLTCDMNVFDPGKQFDRIVSVEMLEHMKNYDTLFSRIATWLKDDAKFFVHVFSHKQYAYLYNEQDPSEWMARYFFTGGIMPSHDLLPSFKQHLKVMSSWHLDGTHYGRTSEAWLQNFDRNADDIRAIFDEQYGRKEARKWMWRWRLFILACAELFGYKDGGEWGVSHYLFEKAK
ncbi:MAG: cyclopropane-fatty-acyl-phospholipid synthase family protein, partial [Verrucomicrobiota bacterium]